MFLHVHTDSESDSEDLSAPDTGNLDDSNDGGPIDQDAELPGDEREDDDEGGSEDLPDYPEEEGRYHTMAEVLACRDLETYFTALDMEARMLGSLESEEQMD